MAIEIRVAYHFAVDRFGFADCDLVMTSICWQLASLLCVPQPEAVSRITEMPGDFPSRIAGSLGLRQDALLTMSQLLAVGAEADNQLATQLDLFSKDVI